MFLTWDQYGFAEMKLPIDLPLKSDGSILSASACKIVPRRCETPDRRPSYLAERVRHREKEDQRSEKDHYMAMYCGEERTVESCIEFELVFGR